MLFDSFFGLWSCFADLDALGPRVIMSHVTSAPAVFKPRAAAATTTSFARFYDGTTIETYGTDCR